jgi:hypothetical protein
MSSQETVLRRPLPLPQKTEDLLKARKVETTKTLNDYVEDAYVRLWENPEFRRLLESVYDEDAVEGSLAIDNAKAAEMIRDFARGEGDIPYLRDRKLATIVKALGVVLRRYSFSRAERERTVHGQYISSQPSNAPVADNAA